MATKIPKELYVVWQGDRNNPAAEINGSVCSYDPGKASFLKRKQKLDQWAYVGYSYGKHNARLVMQSGMYLLEYDELVSTDYNKPYNDPSRFTYRAIQEGIPHQPEIWKNEPLHGFKILHSIHSSGSANKTWQLLDPRGLQFEIKTAMLEEIIKKSGIKKGGEIEAECCWESTTKLIVVE